MYKFGTASLAQLATVEIPLRTVAARALELSPVDFLVHEGVRTLARQRELYAQGRTTPGNIVTWTMESRHFAGPDGLGRAIDVLNWPIDYAATKQFMAIAYAFRQASRELNIPIRWGGDWNENNIPMERGETDIGHFELKAA